MKTKDLRNIAVDAQQMKKNHFPRFDAPSLADLIDLKVGESAKICVENERFWCNVTDIEGENITATVDNTLVETRMHGLNDKDVVLFEKRHVYSIWKDRMATDPGTLFN